MKNLKKVIFTFWVMEVCKNYYFIAHISRLVIHKEYHVIAVCKAFYIVYLQIDTQFWKSKDYSKIGFKIILLLWFF